MSLMAMYAWTDRRLCMNLLSSYFLQPAKLYVYTHFARSRCTLKSLITFVGDGITICHIDGTYTDA